MKYLPDMINNHANFIAIQSDSKAMAQKEFGDRWMFAHMHYATLTGIYLP